MNRLIRPSYIVAGGTLVCMSIVLCAATLFLFFLGTERQTYAAHVIEQMNIVQKEKDIEALTHIYENTKEAREIIASQILPDEKVIPFLGEIETIAREQSVSLVTQSLAEEPGTAPFELLVVTVRLTGSYASVMQTLRIFEYMPYQIRMDAFDIRRSSGSLWEASLTLRVTKYKAS